MTQFPLAPLLAVAIALTACVPAVSTSALSAQSQRPSAFPADITFLQRMIRHHAQAITMSAMVKTRTTRPELRLLAERLDVSQQDEILVMQRWLAEHGVPPGDSSDMHDTHTMAGMLSAEQLAQLSAARAADFDRLFLRCMIQHHEGALQMVFDLRRSPGAARESRLFQFINEIDNDQRAEIRRMQTLLTAWSQ